MKHRAFQSMNSLALAAVMVLFSTTLVFAVPRPSHGERVDARIKEMHARLNITPAQEPLWQRVTQIMEDNTKTLDALIQARIDQAKTMTAIDDLQSYRAITEAHAEGMKKLLPAFEALYASLADAQKHTADIIFREHHHKMASNQ